MRAPGGVRSKVQGEKLYSGTVAHARIRTQRPETARTHPGGRRSAVLAKGFASTSIEELIAAVGITKSGFFYHFRDKGELAKGLMLRYLEHDKECSTTSSRAATN